MCGAGLAASAVHVKFTTTSAHTLLFEMVMFTFKVTFSGLSAQKESTIRKMFYGGIDVSQFPLLHIILLLLFVLFCFFFSSTL